MLYGNMRRMLYLMVLLIAAVEIYADLNTKTNSTQQAIEGANTTLVCTFTPEDGIDITWSYIDESDVGLHNGKLLISRNEVLYKRYDLVDQASLLISNVRQSDAGTYKCSIYSSADYQLYSSSVTLNVLWIEKPHIELPSNTISEGEVATLVCSTSADPTATYKWLREGYAIQSNHPRYVQSSTTGVLTVYHAGYEDFTSFSCIASNSAGSKTSEEVILNVHYIPRFSIRKQGNSIRCIPYGNPAIDQVDYYINGTKQPDLEQVTIDGQFCNTVTCSAENDAGKGNRTELYCPTVKTAPEKPKDLGNQTLVGVLTSILIFLSLSVVMVIVYLALRPGPDFEQKEGRYDDLFDGPSPV